MTELKQLKSSLSKLVSLYYCKKLVVSSMLTFQFYTFGLIYFWQSQLLKSEPIFSQNTKNKAENVVLYENFPLNTGNLVADFFICFF